MDFRSIFMPYCLQKLPDGSWVVLNRRYKPLGFQSSDWVDYADFSARFHGLGPSTLSRIDKDGKNVDGNRVWLYDDGSVPTGSEEHMKAYLERLAILSKLGVRTPQVAAR